VVRAGQRWPNLLGLHLLRPNSAGPGCIPLDWLGRFLGCRRQSALEVVGAALDYLPDHATTSRPPGRRPTRHPADSRSCVSCCRPGRPGSDDSPAGHRKPWPTTANYSNASRLAPTGHRFGRIEVPPPSRGRQPSAIDAGLSTSPPAERRRFVAFLFCDIPLQLPLLTLVDTPRGSCRQRRWVAGMIRHVAHWCALTEANTSPWFASSCASFRRCLHRH